MLYLFIFLFNIEKRKFAKYLAEDEARNANNKFSLTNAASNIIGSVATNIGGVISNKCIIF